MVSCFTPVQPVPFGISISEWGALHGQSPSGARLSALLGRVVRTRTAPDRYLVLHVDCDLGARPSDAAIRADLRARIGDRLALGAVEVAVCLGLGRRTVSRMAASGVLPMRAEGRLVISPDELIRWVLSRREIPTRIGATATSWRAAAAAKAARV